MTTRVDARPITMDPDLARAESEGMVSETAKVSAVDYSPPPNTHRPKNARWAPGAITVIALILAAICVAMLISLT